MSNTHYGPALPVVVQTDAHELGISGTMSHIMANGKDKSILFFSRLLTKCERNFNLIGKH